MIDSLLLQQVFCSISIQKIYKHFQFKVLIFFIHNFIAHCQWREMARNAVFFIILLFLLLFGTRQFMHLFVAANMAR